jgi:hypothetical protein
MPPFLLHLWANPPTDLALMCPAPPPGDPIPPPGFFDPATVSAAYGAAGWASLGAVILLVLCCYLLTRSSLGPGFVKRWWIFLAIAGVVGFLVPLGVLRFWGTRALAGSCVTNPNPFAATLPWSEILDRSVAGLVWAPLAFLIFSLLFTRTAGWLPQSGGFFHNRGCPWPRWR